MCLAAYTHAEYLPRCLLIVGRYLEGLEQLRQKLLDVYDLKGAEVLCAVHVRMGKANRKRKCPGNEVNATPQDTMARRSKESWICQGSDRSTMHLCSRSHPIVSSSSIVRRPMDLLDQVGSSPATYTAVCSSSTRLDSAWHTYLQQKRHGHSHLPARIYLVSWLMA